MPTYEYKCANGHVFEVVQKMSDDPVTACQVCSAPVERVFHPIAVHFKGSGFYTTDYGSGKAAAADGQSDSKADSGKDGGGEKAAGDKAAGDKAGGGGSGGGDSGSSEAKSTAASGSEKAKTD